MTKVAIKDMTFVEFRERLAEKPVIVIPLGSQEEQGPHAPMGDYMLSEKLAELVGEASGALIAPTIPFGYADVFRCVPGGIQLRAGTFCALLEDAITAFLDHGLTHIVLFNGHTGNTALIDQTVRGFKQSHGIIIPSINIWKAIPVSLWHRLHGDLGEKAGGHGADPITSVYYHLFPDLMRPDLIEKSSANKAFGLETSGLSAVRYGEAEVLVPLDVFDVNEHGLIGGDAGLSNAGIGKEFTDYIVSHASGFIRHFRQHDSRGFS
ncbi:creatinine amidohydrolase [Xaviernesmea oryzae]|uniref:Creatinine amidohydrolase n=1 Tax=Xaviernesmea oryzae TaxID=464029 RepID=A0A1X7FY32_9HYPH|nr:creatininase family protein [Xaviernesmea oryzae]SMF60875.1 creatinine amidohydrolase [Xaviernesmea oryzae]